MRSPARPAIERIEVLGNERLAEGVGLLSLKAPRIASSVLPGQFVHIRVAVGADFILRRPFSVHRTVGDRVEVLFQVFGAGTRALAERERGDVMDAIGPLGTGFRPPEGAAHALVVAGGLGVAPMGLLAEALAAEGIAVTVALGAPTRERLFAREALERVARQVVVTTDDGSEGRRGTVAEIVSELIARARPDVVFSCGPEGMSRSVAESAAEAGVPCQVSLERLMACGVGTCLSCMVATRDGQRRACVDGPVFDAAELAWDPAGAAGTRR